MKESQLKTKVIKMLHAEYPDIWTFKVSDKWTSGIPDLLLCINGHLGAIELKVAPNKATKLQEHVINRIRRAGGIAGVAYSVEDVRKILQKGGETNG